MDLGRVVIICCAADGQLLVISAARPLTTDGLPEETWARVGTRDPHTSRCRLVVDPDSDGLVRIDASGAAESFYAWGLPLRTCERQQCHLACVLDRYCHLALLPERSAR